MKRDRYINRNLWKWNSLSYIQNFIELSLCHIKVISFSIPQKEKDFSYNLGSWMRTSKPQKKEILNEIMEKVSIIILCFLWCSKLLVAHILVPLGHFSLKNLMHTGFNKSHFIQIDSCSFSRRKCILNMYIIKINNLICNLLENNQLRLRDIRHYI